ncbi:hypothetical protein PGTUg99_001147 [Puccinia graminis f. sp. tritici]|uniref:Uncharacterized protein n=1 Tax=Puccinia graminis f. sp. tritici TaxID=56615 RepID=A0A5B0NAG3_PUCGR|nr:hypothetical protein PGTUg99_001147 [Puccinia graminis f. sp. tritici]
MVFGMDYLIALIAHADWSPKNGGAEHLGRTFKTRIPLRTGPVCGAGLLGAVCFAKDRARRVVCWAGNTRDLACAALKATFVACWIQTQPIGSSRFNGNALKPETSPPVKFGNDHHAQESKKCTETRSEEREAREAPTKDCDDKRIDELE